MPNRTKTFGRLMAYMWRYKGTALMALVFIFLTSAVTTAIPLLARYYIDHFIGGGLVAQGGLILLAYYSLFLVRVAFTFLGNYTFARVAQSVVRDLRQESFDKLQSLSMRYFDQTPAGAIVSRLTNDTQAVADMFSAIFSSFLSSLVIVAVTIGTMLSLNVPLTLLMLVFIPIMFGSIALYNSKSRDLIAMTRAKLSDLNVKLSESIEGMRIVQAFGQEGRLLAEFEAINADHVAYSNKSLNVNSLFLRPAMSLLKLLAYAVILAYFGVTWQVAGVTAGLMYAFIQYSNQLFNPLIEVTQNFSILQTSMIAADRVFALAFIALILLAIVINIQLNQPEDMHAEYVRLWKTTWHEENKDWLYPLKNICLVILAGLAGSGLMIACSKSERWK